MLVDKYSCPQDKRNPPIRIRTLKFTLERLNFRGINFCDFRDFAQICENMSPGNVIIRHIDPNSPLKHKHSSRFAM